PVRRVWAGIILPQAVRAVLPMLGNIVVSMFKQTALLSTITVLELLAHGMAIGQMTYRFVDPLTLVGPFYFVVSYLSAPRLRAAETGDEIRACPERSTAPDVPRLQELRRAQNPRPHRS